MRLIIALAAASASLIFATPAAAQHDFTINQSQVAGALQAAPGPRPRFVVEAVRFHAYDETGWDRAGSDEVYAVFEDKHNGQRRFTRDHGDTDSGDTQTISRRERCIAPLDYAGYDSSYMPPSTWRCRGPGEAGGFNFRITLFERDGWSPMACAAVPNQQAYKKDCDDDEIATFQHTYSPDALVTMMPNVGDSREVTTARRGGYDFTFRLRRLRDAVDPEPVIQ